MDYQQVVFPYRRHADQDAAAPARHPVVVVGAGPVGLSLAIDLAQRGVPVVLLDDGDRLSTGSRAICFAKRTLEIFDRLGCGQRVTAQGVSWNLGRVFLRDDLLYAFDLLPESGHARPAFVNLQQYVVEGCLVERAMALPAVDLRWKHRLAAIEPGPQQVALTIATPDGAYRLLADRVVACDGSRSTTRRLMGLESEGRVFRDRFLIADVKMDYDGPAERWFWFDPPFHPGQSVLLHRQPGKVWRIDFQLGWDADPDQEKQPERIVPRVQALLAHSAMKDIPFTLEWASVYTFACQRMASFRHGRVLFAGDAAHGVSPFGARGANSGVQDADNLGWKLARVVQGEAGDALLDSYASEREAAADENLRASTRSTDFITPKSAVSRLFRDAVLALAREHGFARTLLNSGRLSVPATLEGSQLNSADVDAFAGRLRPGAVAADAPLQRPDGTPTWLLRELGEGFTLLSAAGGNDELVRDLPVRHLVVAPADAPPSPASCIDAEGLVAQRYDLQPGSAYLIRPDQHVCARWRRPTRAAVEAALRRALGTP
ncbi:FAD-dependent oxidoreductase [uncultured Methylibium sp.]|uniref:FAD-dependent oxidoreductase n=1 Tax=uncultured Methylibium sp. TaxID=381093 RepID=UPI0025D5150D|nr:FAD-dependent oxidoreductase [uncultured Methylibium sp.]